MQGGGRGSSGQGMMPSTGRGGSRGSRGTGGTPGGGGAGSTGGTKGGSTGGTKGGSTGGTKGGTTGQTGGTTGGTQGGTTGGTKGGSTDGNKGGTTGGNKGTTGGTQGGPGGMMGRSRGPSDMRGGSSMSGQGEARSLQDQMSLDKSSNRRLNNIGSVYDLVNSTVTVTTGTGNKQQKVVIPNPLADTSKQKQLLPLLLDLTTTINQSDLPARININTAPRAVLESLPGFQDADIQAILDHRPSTTVSTGAAPDPIFQTTAWLITEANISPKTLSTVERYISASSQVYRFQVVGYFEGGGPATRVEAIVDTNQGRPRVVYWRDLAPLGKGIDTSNGQAP
jgi:DNA uptake protein ComE-like DNA-binding protein